MYTVASSERFYSLQFLLTTLYNDVVLICQAVQTNVWSGSEILPIMFISFPLTYADDVRTADSSVKLYLISSSHTFQYLNRLTLM